SWLTGASSIVTQRRACRRSYPTCKRWRSDMQTTSLAARSLWAHKRRLVGAFIAVFLGVAFLAGTLIVSDTLAASIDHLFVQAFSGTDVNVRNATAVSKSPGAPRGGIDRALLPRVAAVSGVAAAEPVIQGTG